MLNARNTLNVTFDEAIEKIRSMRRAEIVVRFHYRNNEDEEIAVKSIKASALYRDWYGECDICPANDTKIYHLHILMNPACTALDISDDVSFERFMDALEEVTVGHKYNS